MDRRLALAFAVLGGVLVIGAALPVAASPAPLPACPPCDSGFERSATSHGLDTEVQHSSATVQVHQDGSARWTVRVIPTNETVLERLAANDSLATSVAGDSFGTRYGGGIDHELIDARVADGAFIIEYRTLNVVESGPFGTSVLTYFRDSPGAYIYTGLGADELTVVAPEGMTVARGFGEVSESRMQATRLSDARDGPFVVFAPEGSPVPGLLGTLAVASALAGVIVRNLLMFVAVPASILVGGVAAIRRVVDAGTDRDPTVLGSAVAGGGAVLLAGTVLSEEIATLGLSGNAVIGGLIGAAALAVGTAVAASPARRQLTPRRLVVTGIALGALAVAATLTLPGGSGLHQSLSLAVALVPAVVGLGWADAAEPGDSRSKGYFAGIAVLIVGALLASAPVTALGGSLFVLLPALLSIAAVAFVVAAVPLYSLGAAGANTRS